MPPYDLQGRKTSFIGRHFKGPGRPFRCWARALCTVPGPEEPQKGLAGRIARGKGGCWAVSPGGHTGTLSSSPAWPLHSLSCFCSGVTGTEEQSCPPGGGPGGRLWAWVRAPHATG